MNKNSTIQPQYPNKDSEWCSQMYAMDEKSDLIKILPWKDVPSDQVDNSNEQKIKDVNKKFNKLLLAKTNQANIYQFNNSQQKSYQDSMASNISQSMSQILSPQIKGRQKQLPQSNIQELIIQLKSENLMNLKLFLLNLCLKCPNCEQYYFTKPKKQEYYYIFENQCQKCQKYCSLKFQKDICKQNGNNWLLGRIILNNNELISYFVQDIGIEPLCTCNNESKIQNLPKLLIQGNSQFKQSKNQKYIVQTCTQQENYRKLCKGCCQEVQIKSEIIILN